MKGPFKVVDLNSYGKRIPTSEQGQAPKPYSSLQPAVDAHLAPKASANYKVANYIMIFPSNSMKQILGSNPNCKALRGGPSCVEPQSFCHGHTLAIRQS
jgi:hypothetical protein